MKSKGKFIVVCFVSILFGLSGLGSVAKAQSAGGILINADGSVSGTSLIQQEGNVYTLTGNIQDMPITVYRDNIVLNGEGYTLQGAGGWGTPGVAGKETTAAIHLECSNDTVEGFNIIGWEAGVSGANEANTVICNNITQTENAIAVYAANYTVANNHLSNSIYGVYIKASGTTVIGNQIVDNYGGVMLYPSVETTVKMNNFTGNRVEFTIGTYDTFSYQIYLNNFYVDSNTVIVRTTADALGLSGTGTIPSWDNGSVGNYWSNYQTKYPDAAAVGNSSVGGIAYQLRPDTTAVDRYPLMTPVNITATLPTQTAPTSAVGGNESSKATSMSPEPKSNAEETSLVAALIIAALACVLTFGLRKRLFWLQRRIQST